MAKVSPLSKAHNRRGSPEAIEKRKAARIFNDILGGRGSSSQKLDGRTEDYACTVIASVAALELAGAHSTNVQIVPIAIDGRSDPVGSAIFRDKSDLRQILHTSAPGR